MTFFMQMCPSPSEQGGTTGHGKLEDMVCPCLGFSLDLSGLWNQGIWALFIWTSKGTADPQWQLSHLQQLTSLVLFWKSWCRQHTGHVIGPSGVDNGSLQGSLQEQGIWRGAAKREGSRAPSVDSGQARELSRQVEGAHLLRPKLRLAWFFAFHTTVSGIELFFTISEISGLWEILGSGHLKEVGWTVF